MNDRNYSTFICPFEYGNSGKGKGKNDKNLNISRTERAL